MDGGIDFVTWVLLRLDVLMAETDNYHSGDAPPAAQGTTKRVLPFGVIEFPESGESAPPRSAA